MSSDRPNDDPLPAASTASLVELLASRGGLLLDGLETHLPGSREKAEAAAAYALAAAVELGLPRASCELAREAAKLHDVGLVYVPVEALSKAPRDRTEEELILISSHHEKGAQLARGAGLPERVCEWIQLGAERFDGGGPAGLAGEAIPLQARISRAAHACYQALRGRAGEGGEPVPARSPTEILGARAGSDLDPMVVDALNAVLSRAQADPSRQT